jgi:hypothetical protein
MAHVYANSMGQQVVTPNPNASVVVYAYAGACEFLRMTHVAFHGFFKPVGLSGEQP